MDLARGVAVILDVVKSRDLDDRREAQQLLQDVFSETNLRFPATEQMHATVGDEAQAIYPDWQSALIATMAIRIRLLDAGIDCRFGIGRGQILDVGVAPLGVQQDGSAWWRARRAIDETKARARQKNRSLRTWCVFTDAIADQASVEGGSANETGLETLINAYLLTRDELVSSLSARARHIVYFELTGLTRAQIAKREGVTESAISQVVENYGIASLVSGDALMRKAVHG